MSVPGAMKTSPNTGISLMEGILLIAPIIFGMKLYKLLLTQLTDASIDAKDLGYVLDLIAGSGEEK